MTTEQAGKFAAWFAKSSHDPIEMNCLHEAWQACLDANEPAGECQRCLQLENAIKASFKLPVAEAASLLKFVLKWPCEKEVVNERKNT